MKTKSGKTWYVQDLSNYNNAFLNEIIIDLIEREEENKKRIDR
jgi:hypothetical protein